MRDRARAGGAAGFSAAGARPPRTRRCKELRRQGTLDRSVPRIGALQADVGARTRMAALRHLQSALPASADAAGPARGREEVEHVRAAQQADHLAALDDRHAPNTFTDEKPRRLVYARVLADGDDVRAHDVAR